MTAYLISRAVSAAGAPQAFANAIVDVDPY